MDENNICEIWNVLREYIPAKDRQEAANQYVTLIVEDFNVSKHELDQLPDMDDYLGKSVSNLDEDEEDLDDWNEED